MKLAAKKNKILSAIMTCVLAITLMAGFPAVKAYAASGTVYSCAINRCYAHPVTGVIEDSGGESSYATGQGMVEGCVYSNGILEVSDDGAYYLTIRMSLMDYTSGHSFQVQNVGDSGWSTPSEIGITGNGSDSNGTTADVCMRVPSENCIVRGSMYVEPMGRDVIFYLYPSNYSEGNNTDMNATMVTAASVTDNSSNNNNASGAASTDNTSSGNQDGSQASGSSSLQSSTGSQTSGNASLQSGTGNDKNSSSDSDNVEESESETGSAPKLQSSITQAAAPSSSSGTDSSTLNSAEGLSLSTAQDASDEENVSDTDVAKTSGSSAFQIGLAVTVAGLILIAVAAGIVYFFRRNWRRWGGGEDDEEE